MSSPRPEFSRRAVRWLLPAALLALTPKCIFCVLAYTGISVALRLGGPEICGASGGLPVSWSSTLAWFGVASALGTFACFASCRRIRSAPTGNSNDA
jgi:hypothetical protein